MATAHATQKGNHHWRYPQTKAHELWERLPQYVLDIDEPKWSNGWLEGFKKRFNIKEYVQHGEAATADIYSLANITQMEELRQLCATYADEDIFNMDETGSFGRWHQLELLQLRP